MGLIPTLPRYSTDLSPIMDFYNCTTLEFPKAVSGFSGRKIPICFPTNLQGGLGLGEELLT